MRTGPNGRDPRIVLVVAAPGEARTTRDLELSPRTEIGSVVDTSDPDNGCFACSHSNPIALGLRAVRTGPRSLESTWTAQRDHQGAPGVLHGGLQGTLLDDLMGIVVSDSLEEGRYGVTTHLELRYRRPALTETPLQLSVEITGHSGRDVHLEAAIRDADQTLLTTATGTYRVLDAP